MLVFVFVVCVCVSVWARVCSHRPFCDFARPDANCACAHDVHLRTLLRNRRRCPLWLGPYWRLLVEGMQGWKTGRDMIKQDHTTQHARRKRAERRISVGTTHFGCMSRVRPDVFNRCRMQDALIDQGFLVRIIGHYVCRQHPKAP